ncbi:MAG: hypothetical protein IPK71_28820 [Myxococcales bacterium]|nr:hypothetical protein [Myxococcales bacterium]
MSDANELAERVEAARLTLDAATAQLKTILSGGERLPRAEKVQVTDGLADAFTAVRNARDALGTLERVLASPAPDDE